MDDKYNIYDGGHVQHNCTDINRAQFSYNNAVYILGAAYMYNHVGSVPCPYSEMRLTCAVTDQRERYMEATARELG